MNLTANSCDVLILGGGVIGLTTALQLTNQDRAVSVTVLDRREIGREASWAGAGMLPPGNLSRATTPESRLRSYSHALWNSFAATLRERTGIDTGYRICGALQVSSAGQTGELSKQVQEWTNEGLRVETLTRTAIEQHVPAVNPGIHSACFLPDTAQVRNPRHLQALKAACLQAGIRIVEHVEHTELVPDGERIREVRTPRQRLSFDRVCITAGAWSGTVIESAGIRIPVRPVRGQIVQLALPEPPFQCIIEQGRRYLVPRLDGLVLIGSTEEDAGFVPENTPEGVNELRNFAISLVPALASAEIARTWAGLRPGTPDQLPLIGPVPQFQNLFLGTGHFRSGLQMSVGTGKILADLLVGRTPEIPMEGLTPDRLIEHQ